MTRRHIRPIAATLLVIASTALGLRQVSTALACSTGRSDNGTFYYDGWSRSPGSTVGGVYSSILVMNPTILEENGSYSESYVQIKDSSHHAAYGWRHYETSCPIYCIDYVDAFYEYSDSSCGGGLCFGYDSEPGSGSHTFDVLWNATTHHISWYYDTNSHEDSNDNVGWTPNAGDVSGGISTYANQMPGGTVNNDYETFNSSHVYVGGWQAFDGSIVIGPGSSLPFDAQVTDSPPYQNVEIADAAC